MKELDSSECTADFKFADPLPESGKRRIRSLVNQITSIPPNNTSTFSNECS